MGSIYNFLKVVGAWAVVYKGRNTSIRCPDLFIVFLKKAFLFCEIHFMVPLLLYGIANKHPFNDYSFL